MTHSQFVKRAATAGVCIGVGAAAGIAGSAAAPGKSPGSPRPQAARNAKLAAAGMMRPGPAGVMAFKIGFGPVHAVQVVPNKAGDGFDTVTEDSGTVKSVSGAALTITEGTDKATYATPTLTIPAGATVERNFETAKLTDLQAGDHVDVSSDSDGTTSVLAVDAQHWPPQPSLCGKPGELLPPPGAPQNVTATGGPTGPAASIKVAAGQAAGGAASGAVVGVGGPGGGVICSAKAP